MSGFNLDNYVDVPSRLKMALEKFPELRVQETQPVIVTVDGQQYVQISCTIWRDATDTLPMVAYCWEPIPGKTPYTRGSEMMNASTSCFGRCLGFLGFGITKSIASRNEVQARQPGELAVVVPFPDVPQRFEPSTKQLGMMRGLANAQGIKGDDLKVYCSNVLGRTLNSTGDLDKKDISKIIDALKLGEVTEL